MSPVCKYLLCHLKPGRRGQTKGQEMPSWGLPLPGPCPFSLNGLAHDLQEGRHLNPLVCGGWGPIAAACTWCMAFELLRWAAGRQAVIRAVSLGGGSEGPVLLQDTGRGKKRLPS